MAKLDLELIRHALETARGHGLRQISITLDDDEFEAVLSDFSDSNVAVEEESEAVEETTPRGPVEATVCAHVVGYLRRIESSPEPGSRVEQGKAVATIAALGLQNDLIASSSGEWLEWLVDWDQPVEYGQPIGRVRESA